MLVGEGDAKGGIAVLKFNADAHPTSSNAWDSLGDAYLADGQREKAREASEKALELVGSDPSESAGAPRDHSKERTGKARPAEGEAAGLASEADGFTCFCLPLSSRGAQRRGTLLRRDLAQKGSARSVGLSSAASVLQHEGHLEGDAILRDLALRTMAFCDLTQADRTFCRLLSARLIPALTASSKLFEDEAMISVDFCYGHDSLLT